MSNSTLSTPEKATIPPVPSNDIKISIFSYTCPICLTQSTVQDTKTTCSNKHHFCKNCLTEYLKNLISQAKIHHITCPQENCQEILQETLIKESLDHQTFQLYQRQLLSKALNQKIKVNFCPKPGCSRPITPSNYRPYTTCKCNSKICNICGNFWHQGKTCIESMDLDLHAFSQANDIKFCVMCKSLIHLAHGCTHITCPICDYEWCWTCGCEYYPNHYNQCTGIWNPVPPARVLEEKGVKMWTKIKRFLFTMLLVIFHILILPVTAIVCQWEDPHLRGRYLWTQVVAAHFNAVGTAIWVLASVIAVLAYYFAIVMFTRGIINDADDGDIVKSVFLWLEIGFLLTFVVFLIIYVYRVTKAKVNNTRWKGRNSKKFKYTDKARANVQN